MHGAAQRTRQPAVLQQSHHNAVVPLKHDSLHEHCALQAAAAAAGATQPVHRSRHNANPWLQAACRADHTKASTAALTTAGSGWRTSQASSLKPPREWRICGVRVEGTTWAAIPSAEGSSQHGAALASMQRKTRSNNATSSRQGAHIQPAVCWLGCLELNLVEPANHPIIRHCTGVAGTTPLGEAQGPGQLGWRVLLKSCGAGSRGRWQQGSP